MTIILGRTLGEVIHTARREKRLTLEDLAKLIGSTKSYLSSIELGKVGPPRPKLLKKMSEALGLDLGLLLAFRVAYQVPSGTDMEALSEILRRR
jgi:transcriptional regulator with XRE-family HTH domain